MFVGRKFSDILSNMFISFTGLVGVTCVVGVTHLYQTDEASDTRAQTGVAYMTMICTQGICSLSIFTA